MNKFRTFLIASLTLFFGVQAAHAAPYYFTSPNYGMESVIFGGTGVLHSSFSSIPPVITVQPTVTNITQTSATVSWQTDKLTNALVEVGTVSGNYTIETGNIDDISQSSHSVDLTFLQKNTQYYYIVRSADISGNVVFSTEQTFHSDVGDITPPVFLTGPTISQTSTSSVEVTWTTNEPSSSTVQYGVNSVTESSTGNSDDLTTFHQVNVTVQTAQTYQLRAETKDASGNVAYSPIQTFTTLPAPSITNVQISDVTLNSALVQWQTSVQSTSIISYGVTSNYGQTEQDTSTYTQSHLLRLNSLTSGSIYHFRISGADAAGNRLNSDEYIFQTVVLPTISNFQVSSLDATDATFTWTSSSDINEFVQYTVVSSQSTPADVGTEQGTGHDTLTTTHSFTVSDLDSSSVYSVYVSGNDVFGNKAVSNVIQFTTPVDHTPPVIQNLQSQTTVDTGSDQSVQVLVSFGLSKDAKAIIEYGPGATGSYTQKVTTDSSYSKNKFLVIPGLKPGDSYHYHIIATDKSGNTTTSPDYLVLAPTQPVSLLDLIFGQVQQNFGWLSNL